MKILYSLAILASLAFAADDPWNAVSKIKSGAEMRIYKRGVAQPIAANMDELTNEKLLVVVKKEQVAIPRDQIDRIDARPPQTTSRLTKNTKEETTTGRDGLPKREVSSGVNIGGKPDFETVYRRTAASGK